MFLCFKYNEYKACKYELSFDFKKWILLFLLLFIPGLYIEYPSDPWEHLNRIISYENSKLALTYPYSYKFSYSFYYSLISIVKTKFLLFTLIYYTLFCLLLFYQYFKLSLNLGLPKYYCYYFVLIQFFLFGNNVFSFYRYYGLASSLLAQLGFIATINIVCEVNKNIKIYRSLGVFVHFKYIVKELIILCLAILLIISNHIQALGFCIVFSISFLCWLYRKYYLKLIIIYIILNLLSILYFKNNDCIKALIISNEYISCLYIFKIYNVNSQAFEKFWQILGVFGSINILLSVYYLFKNKLIGYISIVPIILLISPFFVLPLCVFICNDGKQYNTDYILIYHRILFSIPPGLSIILFIYEFEFSGYLKYKKYLLIIFVFLFIFIPPDKYGYNRFLNLFSRLPSDLKSIPTFAEQQFYINYNNFSKSRNNVLGAGRIANTFASMNYSLYQCTGRILLNNSEHENTFKLRRIEDVDYYDIYYVDYTSIYTPMSYMAYYSKHWSPYYISLSLVNSVKLIRLLENYKYQSMPDKGFYIYRNVKWAYILH